MAETALTNAGASITRPAGWRGIAADWSSDQRAFKNVSWGKAMMWLFLLSETLILSAIMTFILISSSGTMAMAVNFGYRRDRTKTAALMLATAAFGATFVGMQAFEWSKLIMEGVRPWGNPWGAAQS